MLGPDLTVLNAEARGAVMSDLTGEGFPWATAQEDPKLALDASHPHHVRQHKDEKAAVAVSDQKPDNADGRIERVRGSVHRAGQGTLATNVELAETVDPTAPATI